jgi:pimeloyl-ACP methyl ester carboxylesterase
VGRDLVHRQLPLDCIELHVAECGGGPPVVLLHGFPEIWYSWRHQLPALADAGFHAIAPDLRGFGRSSAPPEIAAYALDAVCRDLLALLDSVGERSATFVGHDWGAAIAWQIALEHPGLVTAVVGLSVPFVPRAPARPISLLRKALGEDFYIVWFQEPGIAERALERDVRRTLTTTRAWTAAWGEGDDRPPLPPWLTEEDLQVYVDAFERSGFGGGLNYYRNIDRNWERSAHLINRRVEPPALFVTGSRDPVQGFMPAEAMDGWVTDLRGVIRVGGAGHWVQQERPDEVNDAVVGFLRGLDPV